MSLSIGLNERFFPDVEFGKFPFGKRAIAGNPRKGDTQKQFPEPMTPALAFIRALYSYVGDNAMAESRGEIDSYAMRDGETGCVCAGGRFWNRAAPR